MTGWAEHVNVSAPSQLYRTSPHGWHQPSWLPYALQANLQCVNVRVCDGKGWCMLVGIKSDRAGYLLQHIGCGTQKQHRCAAAHQFSCAI